MTETPFGPSGELIFRNTYARTRPDGQLETWPETVRRVAAGNLALVYGDDSSGWSRDVSQEYEDLVEYMEDFRIIPGGRHLWATGVKGRQFLSNCHVAGWGDDKLSDHFSFTFLRLMEGGGVGANYSSKHLRSYGAPRRRLDVHIVCDPSHPDYNAMRDAGLLSEVYHPDWAGAFTVEDSREGWADALTDLIDTYMSDGIVRNYNRVYDVTNVRARGSRLKTFGGTASGPLPFAQLLHTASKVLNANWDSDGHETRYTYPQLSPLDAMEIDHAIGECVVSGGVRRSARMSIVHWDDPFILDFLNCKADTSKHWTTNISVEVDDRFIEAVASGDVRARQLMLRVAEGMLTNGEPGLWNSSLSQVGEVNRVIATNPCVTSDTWVMTSEGARQVADLIGVPFEAVVEGEAFPTLSDGFFFTGEKETITLRTSEGYELKLTPDHRILTPSGWVEAGELSPGDEVCLSDNSTLDGWDGNGSYEDGYVLGHLVGDGTFDPDGRAFCESWGNDGDAAVENFIEAHVRSLGTGPAFKGWRSNGDRSRRISTKGLTELADRFGIRRGNKTVTSAVEEASSSFYRGFLSGVFDTDGHVEGSSTDGGISIRLTWTDLDGLKAVQRMLARLGIRSAIRPCHPEGRESFKGYRSAASHRLIISGEQSERFMRYVTFHNEAKADKWYTATRDMSRGFYRKPYVATVEAIEPGEVLPVYDVTVADVHAFDANGILAHNCGEISLEAWENCNLGHVNLDAFADRPAEELGRAHELMTRFLIRATYADHNDDAQAAVVAANRRIGVGHLGVQGFLVKHGIRYSEAPSNEGFKELLRSLYATVRLAADDYAFELRIPSPVKTTTVAPTGTIAKLPGVSEGIHPIFARHFIRRIRWNVSNPQGADAVAAAEADGFVVEPDAMDPSGYTKVVEYPSKDPLVDEAERLGIDPALIESQDELSVDQLLDFQAMYQELWADNAVSFTINVPAALHQELALRQGAPCPPPTQSAVIELAMTLVDYLPHIKGTTVMVDGTRPQAPYERISEDEFAKAHSHVVIDGIDDECATGACPIR